MTHCRGVPGSIHLYKRLLHYVRPFRGRAALAVGAATISSAAAAGYSYLIGPLLKSLFLGENVVLAGRILTDATLLWLLPTLVVGAAVLKASFQLLHSGWMQGVGQRVVANLRRDLYSKL
ncbi:MAG: ABC transporter ATP-binding protein, partial [Myxococcaceae bacterium]